MSPGAISPPSSARNQSPVGNSAPVGLCSLAGAVRRQLADCDSWESARTAAAGLVERLTSARWVGVLVLSNTNTLALAPGTNEPESMPAEWRREIEATARQSLQEARTSISPTDAELTVIAAPLTLAAAASESLVAALHLGSQDVEPFVLVLQLVACELARWWQERETRRSQLQLNQVAAILELTSAVAAASNASARQTLVNLARNYTGCPLIALATTAGKRRCQLRVVSESAKLDAATELARCLEDALEEARLHGEVIEYRSDRQAASAPFPAHQKLAQQCRAEQIITVPLKNREGASVAVWTFVGHSERLTESELVNWLAVAAEPVAAAVELIDRTRDSWLNRSWRAAWGAARSRWVVVALIASVLSVVAGATIRVPYRVSTPCILQPVTRRFVAAPFAGHLERSFVKPGDRVQRGQVLARMEGRDLRTELAALTAELERAAKDREVNLALGKVAGAQIAALEMERLNQRKELLLRRTEQLEIRCPLDGLVIAGDLQRSEGAPVSIGQALFEVAPLDRMVCELAVPDEEIAYVERGQPAVFSFDAHAGQSWSGQLGGVHPRSEIRDSHNVFVAEVELDNAQALLRPGMKGQSKITTEPRTLVWIALHRPWQRLLTWLSF